LAILNKIKQENGIWPYSGRNYKESFCEMFALITDPLYDRNNFPLKIRQLEEIIRKEIGL
jgi:hypothetical protein